MFTRELRVMPSDADFTGRIKLFNVLNYFQDTAELAVEKIEGSSVELYERGFAWVISRYEINFHDVLPSITQNFSVSTYHDPNHGYNTLRCFELSAGGKIIVSAKTAWLLVDVKAGRPVKPLANLPEISGGDRGEISPDFSGTPHVVNVEREERFNVHSHDTDYNGHVNHAVYFRWLSDFTGKNFRRICASFRSGAKLGEEVRLCFEGNLCAVMRGNNTRPCAEFMTEDFTQ